MAIFKEKHILEYILALNFYAGPGTIFQKLLFRPKLY